MSNEISSGSPTRFESKIPMRPAVLVATFLILVWLLFMLYETTNMTPPILLGYPGDAFFPRIVLIYALICAGFILIRGLLLPRGASLFAGEAATYSIHWPEFATVCVLVLAYGLLLEPVGFEISTFALLMILLTPRIRAGQVPLGRSLIYALALALPTTFISYVSFGLLLRIPLPLLFLPRYIQF
ncbi:MAG: tripartite tricarboxylate transporter TctB family protein [Pseudomonadales bacterium]